VYFDTECDDEVDLNIAVVDQRELELAMRCDHSREEAQGFLCCMPMAKENFERIPLSQLSDQKTNVIEFATF
jgi:hypothetical protein